MTKAEMIAALKENALNVKNAEDTIANIETKEVNEAPKGEGVVGLDSELPTQKDIEAVVTAAEGPMVAVDKDGISKDGGNDDALMGEDKIEAERKKQDNGMKDVINVSTRKVEESAEVHNELLEQLKEASSREESYKAKIAEISSLCEKALEAQKSELTNAHAAQMNTIFEKVIAEGEKIEQELVEAAEKNEKMYKTAKKLHESSSKINKILLEAVKSAQPAKSLTRYVTPARRAIESVK